MTRNEIIDQLLEYFINENKQFTNDNIPKNIEEKRILLRGLINLRLPKPVSEEILKLEDQLLQCELKDKNITDIKDIKPTKDQICIWLGDITSLKIDAIVNACNNTLLGCFIPNHSCIDNAIHSSSGIRLRLACHDLMKGSIEKIGSAKITRAYNLPSRYVIHTVGPSIENNVTEEKRKQLENCYLSCLELARTYKIRTLAFPSISTGVFRFPKDQASEIAVNTVRNYLKKHSHDFDKIVFNVFTKEDAYYYDRLLKS